MSIITRFAPSPTGYFHVGSYRTALFSCIFARKNGGKFILRIEDTDKERSKKEYEENIIESLEWMGLKYDEFYRQSDRTDIYKKYIEKLIASGHAYVSQESAPEGGRAEVIRFKNPKKKVAFEDMIRGKVEFDTTELGDFVIAKSLTEPVFHLVVVIDDLDMGITHIIRGEDHISNTPRQILLYEALGATPPNYAHIPLLLAADRSKLSKRNGAVPVTEYRRRGFLPEAVVNYLALLGWHPKDNRELFTFDEIVKTFELDRVQKGGAIFDEDKLKWFNHQYITKLSDEEFIERAGAFMPEWLSTGGQLAKNIVSLLREKITTFEDISTLCSPQGELGFVKALPQYDKSALLWKKDPNEQNTLKHLEEVRKIISGLNIDEGTPVQAKAEAVKNALWSYAESAGKGNVLWPLRMSLTGQDKSPDPFISSAILGREESLSRIDIAIKKLSA